MIKNTNDNTNNEPYLRLDINYASCNGLPYFSKGPRGADRRKYEMIKAAGYAGIQDGDPLLCGELGLKLTAHARIIEVGGLDHLIGKWKDENYDCTTLHLGLGMESDYEMDRLVDYVINASVKNDFPIYIETHRATITQDMQRTVALIKRFPEIRFNGDFSHWYTGQEMVYGGIENKWEFIAPVFERTRFLHGRIANPGCIQVDVGDGKGRSFVDHFREMWIRSFKGFLKSAKPGDFICFTIELLPPDFFYARIVKDKNGNETEEGDRWEQGLLYKEIAQECWRQALTIR